MADNKSSDWFLKEHLAAKEKSNKWLQAQTGFTHRITNQLINRTVRFNSDHLAAVVKALEIETFELFLHPAEAADIRRIRASYYRELQATAAERVGLGQPSAAPGDRQSGNIHSINRQK